MREFGGVITAILACGLFGSIYGAFGGTAVAVAESIYEVLQHGTGGRWSLTEFAIVWFWMSLYGLVPGVICGWVFGVIGGIIGGRIGWGIGGWCGGLVFATLVQPRGHLGMFWLVDSLPGYVPGLVLGIAGTIIGWDSLRPRSSLPLVERLMEIVNRSAIVRWPFWVRLPLGLALPLTACGYFFATTVWPVFESNRQHIPRHGVLATLKGSYRLGTVQYGSYRMTCQSNLKQVALAVAQYTYDHDEKFPPVAGDAGTTYGWADAIYPYHKDMQRMQCPKELFDSSHDPRQSDYTDYWFNSNLSSVPQAALESSSQTILAGDGNDGVDLNDARYSKSSLPALWLQDRTKPSYRHLDGANYSFADGHAKWLLPKTVTTASTQTNQATFAVK